MYKIPSSSAGPAASAAAAAIRQVPKRSKAFRMDRSPIGTGGGVAGECRLLSHELTTDPNALAPLTEAEKEHASQLGPPAFWNGAPSWRSRPTTRAVRTPGHPLSGVLR